MAKKSDFRFAHTARCKKITAPTSTNSSSSNKNDVKQQQQQQKQQQKHQQHHQKTRVVAAAATTTGAAEATTSSNKQHHDETAGQTPQSWPKLSISTDDVIGIYILRLLAARGRIFGYRGRAEGVFRRFLGARRDAFAHLCCCTTAAGAIQRFKGAQNLKANEQRASARSAENVTTLQRGIPVDGA